MVVAQPKIGMHKWIGSMDLNSLYPSVIRAMNMGPETIIGQCRLDKTHAMVREKMDNKASFAEAWEGIFNTLEYDLVQERDIAEKITVDWENGSTDQYTGAEIYDLVHNQGNSWGISANGTIFRYDNKGIIPNLLERWYAERKEMQKNLQKAIDDNDKRRIEFWDKSNTIALGLNVPGPLGGNWMLHVLSECNGIAVSAKESDLEKATEDFKKMSNIHASPEAGVVWSAYQSLKNRGWIGLNEKVVLFATGVERC